MPSPSGRGWRAARRASPDRRARSRGRGASTTRSAPGRASRARAARPAGRSTTRRGPRRAAGSVRTAMATATTNHSGAAVMLQAAIRCQRGSVVHLPRSRRTARPCPASASAPTSSMHAPSRATTSDPTANPSATTGAPTSSATIATMADARGRMRLPATVGARCISDVAMTTDRNPNTLSQA